MSGPPPSGSAGRPPPTAYPVINGSNRSPPPFQSVGAPSSSSSWNAYSAGTSFYIGGSAAPSYGSRRIPPPPSLPAQRTMPQQSNSFRPLPEVMVESTCCCCGTTVRFARAEIFQCSMCQTINAYFPREWTPHNRSNPPPPPPTPPEVLSAQNVEDLASRLEVTRIVMETEGVLVFEGQEDPEQSLIRHIRVMFSSSVNMTASFRDEKDKPPRLETIDAFYDLVRSRPKAITALSDTLEAFLRNPGRYLRELDSAWAIVLFECPLFTSAWTPNAEKRFWLVSRLVGLLANAQSKQTSWIFDYCSKPTYSRERLEGKVDLLNAFISLRISGSRDSHGGHAADWGVRAGAKVAAIIHHANTFHRRLPVTAFYCTMIDTIGSEIMVNSYAQWKDRSTRFSLCGYPFLLSLGIKMELLAYDGKKQMERQLTNAFIQSLSTGILHQPILILHVRRDHLVQDSLREISGNRSELKKTLKVAFDGEEGVDAGGVRKEWFLLLVRQLFDPQFGMFVFHEDTGLCWFNPASFEAADEFWLVGAILGLAMYNNVTLDVPLPLVRILYLAESCTQSASQAVYKKVKKEELDMEDLAVFNPSLVQGLKQLLNFEGDVAETFCRTFVGEYESWGEVQEIPLKEGGADIAVDNENREEYVKLLVDFLLNKSVQAQFDSFAAGFENVASGDAFRLVAGEEVELLVRGSREPLDLEQLRSVTEYENFPAGAQDPTVLMFWMVFASMDADRQRKLLSFITGSDRIPATGTTALRMKLTCAGEDTGRYPSAHTCFNQLVLYRYRTRWIMEDRIMTAMDESEGFGLK